MVFDWNNSEFCGLAKQRCTQCLGIGLRRNGRGQEVPCGCVLRKIFRVCYAKFRLCVSKEKPIGRVRLESVKGTEGNFAWAMKDEEFVADFILISQRTLTPEEYRIFRYYFLLSASWRLCCKKLGVDRGTFFHQIYVIEEKLGRVYRELKPYALYPLDEYFGGSVRRRPPEVAKALFLAAREDQEKKVVPIRPPLKKAA